MDSSVEERSKTLEAFAASAEELLSANDPLKRRLRLAKGDRSYDRSTWSSLAEAGWFATLVPEAYGGMDLGLDAAAVLAEAAGRHLLPEPFVASAAQCAVLLSRCPAGKVRDELLAMLVDGSTVMASAWQEAAGELDISSSSVVLTSTGTTDVLTGTKQFVDPGDGADGWLVLASRDGEPVLVWVGASTHGARVELLRRIDGGRWAYIHFEGVEVAAENILAAGSMAINAVLAGMRSTRLLQAAELNGVSRRALELTLDYVRTRVQFGKPIGSFQAIQHKLVDAAIQLELAAASMREALQATADDGRLAEYADRTKARAAIAALTITRLAIQLHGALGITRECDIGHYFTRAISLNACLGTSRDLRLRWSHATHVDDKADALDVDVPENVDDVDWNTLSDAQVRRIFRSFLEANYPQEFRHLPLQYVHLDQIRDWNRILYERGWRAPAWPRSWGGLGLSPAKLIALHEEKERYGVARSTDQGCDLLGPLLIRFGSEEQRRKYLPKILSGEHLWCQGYSEPNAGSDLASLRMTADIDGDHFVVNGRKIWTSYAHEATHIFLLVRTDKGAKPHAGISFLLAEMNTPGITLRTIPDLAGDESFCEVEFVDVRVPRENLVGELHQGWTLAKSLLGHERLQIGNPASVNRVFSQLRTFAKHRGLFDDAAFRERWAEVALDVADLNSLYARFADVVRKGQEMPPEVSMLKIFCTEVWQRASALLSETANEPGVCQAPQRIGDEEIHLLAPTFNALPGTIYGGSNEIQRNILARQVLGLAS
jgi:alkylation response protein AidB-like acyl-CoA dehydrogenase